MDNNTWLNLVKHQNLSCFVVHFITLIVAVYLYVYVVYINVFVAINVFWISIRILKIDMKIPSYCINPETKPDDIQPQISSQSVELT